MKKALSVLLTIAMMFTILSAFTTGYADDDFKLTMQIGSPVMNVGGTEKPIDAEDTAPVIVNDRTLLPIRAVVEEMGGKVAWNGETREVTLNYDNNEIRLTIDSTEAYLNNELQTLDTAPTIINDRTMLPIRFIAESFGFDVAWEPSSKTVTITRNVSNEKTDDLNAVVVYFSRMGEQYGVGVVDKGNTAIVADMIADATGADKFEILPKNDTYPTTYDELTKVAKEEQKNNVRPEIASELESFHGYDTVFLGYPIWWSDLPMIMYTFLESYDFDGKTVIPFCTHAGSGLSNTVESIKKALPHADVKDGLAAEGEDAQKKKDKVSSAVDEWLDELGIFDADETTDAFAKTETGLVRGNYSDGIYEYLGVPYAEAKERFVKAQNVAPWDGVKDATGYGDMSIQGALFGAAAQGEAAGTSNNCQNLNIWTPSISDNKKRAVMVWLHGGGFSTGSANEEMYDGENLSRSGDVVVVGVNHRLNVFGHLDLSAYGDKYKNSENIGIQDIVDALEWVQDNIENFGGDPDNVTIFGESGGGAKVLALMTTPYAKGLFTKGIVESGATEGMGVYFSKKEHSVEIGALTLKKLGLTAETVDEIQNMDVVKIQNASDEAKAEIAEKYKVPVSIGEGYAYEWEPVVDGDFLPADPILENGFAEAGKDIPLLIGSNLNEWSIWMPVVAHTDMSDEAKAEYTKAYPNEDPNGATLVDTLIRKPMLKIMSHKADQNGAKVYAYVFTKQMGDQGSYHTAEIPYVFNNTDDPLAKTMSEAWVNFAKTGVPSADGLETWEPYTRESMATMILDDTSYLAHEHDRHLIELLEPDYEY